MANHGKEPYAAGLRTLPCQWCAAATVHDTHKAWLHCSTCQRCYTCGEATPCGMCQRFQRSTLSTEQTRGLPLDWLEQAMQWIREGKAS